MSQLDSVEKFLIGQTYINQTVGIYFRTGWRADVDLMDPATGYRETLAAVYTIEPPRTQDSAAEIRFVFLRNGTERVQCYHIIESEHEISKIVAVKAEAVTFPFCTEYQNSLITKPQASNFEY